MARSRQKLNAFGGSTSFFQAASGAEKMLVRISATDDFLYVGGSASGGNPCERQKNMEQIFLTSPARRGN